MITTVAKCNLEINKSSDRKESFSISQRGENYTEK